MRTAITLHRLHGEDRCKLATGPEVAIDQQVADAKALANAGRVHPTIAEIQIWTGRDGIKKRFKFRSPAEQAAIAAAAQAAAPAPETTADEADADLAAQAAGAESEESPSAQKKKSKSKSK
ncbi:MAG: hypothetical protein ABMA13_20095 [Chthoniobacteraceae bacterium]